MKFYQNTQGVQLFGQIIIQALGRIILIGGIVILVSVWALTEPFYEWSRQIARGGKLKTKQIKN